MMPGAGLGLTPERFWCEKPPLDKPDRPKATDGEKPHDEPKHIQVGEVSDEPSLWDGFVGEHQVDEQPVHEDGGAKGEVDDPQGSESSTRTYWVSGLSDTHYQPLQHVLPNLESPKSTLVKIQDPTPNPGSHLYSRTDSSTTRSTYSAAASPCI